MVESINAHRDEPGLNEADLADDPIEQFARWFADAERTDLLEPAAMTLATAGRDAIPTARIVLLRGFDHRGFVFFTNYQSLKGRQLAENPEAALVWHWDPLRRQVRATGRVAKTSREESERYFASRALGSRLAAWASRQSEVLESRKALEKKYEEARARFPTEDVPLPPFWGGYRLCPRRIEFWQSRRNRLHDRFAYALQPDGAWLRRRLSP